LANFGQLGGVAVSNYALRQNCGNLAPALVGRQVAGWNNDTNRHVSTTVTGLETTADARCVHPWVMYARAAIDGRTPSNHAKRIPNISVATRFVASPHKL
jgi:hypothetical protein